MHGRGKIVIASSDRACTRGLFSLWYEGGTLLCTFWVRPVVVLVGLSGAALAVSIEQSWRSSEACDAKPKPGALLPRIRRM